MIEINFNPFPVLTTERLVLRALKPSDEQTIFRLRTEPQVIQHIARLPYTDTLQATNFITFINKASANNESIFWAITQKESGAMIGTACIWNINKANERAEIGYDLLPEHQGKGWMSEAIAIVIKYGFNDMKLHSLEANINPANNASIKLAERAGFIKEAHFKENVLFEGEWRDTLIYSLLAKNFKA